MERKPKSSSSSATASGAKRRKRGAQPGNSNALKHGFYARHFEHAEITRLEQVQNGLADEISMLRLAIQRMVALATAEENSAAEWQKTLQALGLASQRLARLVKLQHEMTGEQDLEGNEFYAAIREVLNENGWGQE